MTHIHSAQLETTYHRYFNEKSTRIVIAPGRINLIGEHTDYSEGFVLPVAIDRNVTIAFSPRSDRLVRLYSIDFNEYFELNLDDLHRNLGGWKDYVSGIAWALLDSGYRPRGWQGVVAGNIPIGAGLSSSAALEVAIAKAFCLSSNIEVDRKELALLSQNAEINWVGVNVGIMDQLISAAGKAGNAMLLDCRTIRFEYVPIPEHVSFIVMDTMTRRELTHSSYNVRHNEVRQATEILGIRALRDADDELLQTNRTFLPSPLYQRVKHVITENERVQQFATSMRNGDLIEMGHLINQSHISLSEITKSRVRPWI